MKPDKGGTNAQLRSPGRSGIAGPEGQTAVTDYQYGALWFALIVLAVVLLVTYDRLRHRMSKCRWCTGGRIYSPFSGRWRECPFCDGSGTRGAGRKP